MARKVINVALNGVTGRMGYRQHLVRSLLAHPRSGRRHAAGRHHHLPGADPGRPQREPAARDRRAARPERWSTSLDEVLSDPRVDVYFDTQVTSAREASLAKAIAAGKHVYTEKPVASSLDGRAPARRGRPRRRHHARRRAGQAVPAGHDQAAQAGQGGLLRPGAVGPARVRLLGLRGRPDRRPAPVLELPRRRRRRDRARHVPALAVPARGPVRPDHGRCTPGTRRTCRSAGTSPAQPTT